MFKKFLTIFFLFLLTNCGAPGTALLGPIFTGATTKSVAQASLSAGTNQVLRTIHSSSKEAQILITNVTEKLEIFTKSVQSKKTSSFHQQ